MKLQIRESRASGRLAQAACVPMLAAVALTLVDGCSTMPRSPSVSYCEADSHSVTQSSAATTAAAARAKSPEVQYVKYELERGRDSAALTLWPEGPPRLQWAAGKTISSSEPPATGTSPNESLFSKDYWKLTASDVKQVFTAPVHWEAKEWLVSGSVFAGIGLTMLFDEDIQKAVQRRRSHTVDDIFGAIEPFGQEYSLGLLGAFYVGGEIFKDPRAKSVALDGLAASIIASGLIDQPLKYAVERSRPSKGVGAYGFRPFSGSGSFPSGHTTEAFAVATVISEHYESLWVKIPSYGLATAVGYARMNSDAHWASDVLAGAAIGTFVSEVVVRFNKAHRHLALMPLIAPGLKGAELVWSF